MTRDISLLKSHSSLITHSQKLHPGLLTPDLLLCRWLQKVSHFSRSGLSSGTQLLLPGYSPGKLSRAHIIMCSKLKSQSQKTRPQSIFLSLENRFSICSFFFVLIWGEWERWHQIRPDSVGSGTHMGRTGVLGYGPPRKVTAPPAVWAKS